MTSSDAPVPDTHTLEQWMQRGRAWLDGLPTPQGLRASSATGRYHALFGRDTLITILLVLEAARLYPADAACAAGQDS